IVRCKFPERAGQVGAIAAPLYEANKLAFLGGLNLGLRVGQLFKVYADWEDLLIGDPTLYFQFVNPQTGHDLNEIFAYANLPLDLTQKYRSPEVWESWMERGLRDGNYFLTSLAIQMLSKPFSKDFEDGFDGYVVRKSLLTNLASESR